MATQRQRKPRNLGWVAFAAAGFALALPAPAQAAFPGANGRLAFTTTTWHPPPPEPPPTIPTPGLPIEPVPVSTRLETALQRGRGRRVLRASPVEPGYYSGPGVPAWSPNGRMLVFGHEGRLAIMRHDGSGLRTLRRFTDFDDAPAPSPDGRRVAFSGTRGCCDTSLFTVRNDGSGLRQVVGYDAIWPAWSVTDRFAFLNNDDEYMRMIEPRDGLYSVRPDGSGLRRLFGRFWGLGTQPDWSPDGRQLAFNARGRIFTMRANGRGVRRLSANYPRYGHPAWSPDGQYIAFTRSDAASRDRDGLYVMRSDGSGVRRIVEARSKTSRNGRLVEWETIEAPSWQPLPRS
jgi:Tol biopolymer transport system component